MKILKVAESNVNKSKNKILHQCDECNLHENFKDQKKNRFSVFWPKIGLIEH